MYQAFQEMSERAQSHLVSFTQEIIRTPSYSLGEANVAAMFHDLLKELEFDQVFCDDAGNVVGIIVGSDPGPTVLLNSHMDTVAGSEWPDDLTSGRIENGRVHGLGAADCKSGLAAQAFAGYVLAKSGLPLHGDVVVAGTVAEQNGCSVGVRHLLENTLKKLGMKPSYAVLGEPTGLGLYYGHDGWVRMDIHVRGSERAAVRLAAILILYDLKEAGGDLGFQGGGILVKHPDPQVCVRGEAYEAAIQMSRRIFPGETADDCVEYIRERAAAATKPVPNISLTACAHAEQQKLYTGMDVDVVCQTEPWITDPLQPMFDRARQGLMAAGWDRVPVQTWNLRSPEMGTAGSLLASVHKIPTLGFGPGEVTMAHAPNESVDIANLSKAVYGTAVVVHSLIGAPLNAMVRN